MNAYPNDQFPDLLSDLGNFSEKVNALYLQAIDDYHVFNSIDAPISNPYQAGLEQVLYQKCWIDTVQWHVEDEVRRPDITGNDALLMKRRIDALNQERTNQVELIDNYLLMKYRDVQLYPNARINTESPAWALDRLSILALKIYHMAIETKRDDASPEHVFTCAGKLAVLYEQRDDILKSINELLQDISSGQKCMKVYRQMKMYNDPNLNPVLYQRTSKL